MCKLQVQIDRFKIRDLQNGILLIYNLIRKLCKLHITSNCHCSFLLLILPCSITNCKLNEKCLLF